MLRAIPTLSQYQDPLIEIPITSFSGQRDIAPVGSPALAIDESFNSYARLDSASWQTLTAHFERRWITKVRIKSHTYEGEQPYISIAGKEIRPNAANEIEELEVNGFASSLNIYDATGGRTRLYELSVFGHENEPLTSDGL